jgi:cytochrome c
MIVALLAAIFLGSDVSAGHDLFERRCSGCHALDRDKEGPRLRGVFGRRAASVPAFTYSDALKKANITWDAGTLDRWLADPEEVATNNDMAFRLVSREERRAIIEFLKTLPHE